MIKLTKQVHDDFVDFQHFGDGFFLIVLNIPSAFSSDIDCQGICQILGDADVIYDQATFFVAKDTVDAGDGLHKRMTAHEFVNVHGLQRPNIKTREEHITDDDEFERVFGVFQSVANGFTAMFGADVFRPVKLVAGGACHNHLDCAFIIFGVMPIRSEFDDLFIHLHTDAAGHANDHAFAFGGGETLFKMIHQVSGDLLDTRFTANYSFNTCPF